jgi:hypothetical protein
MTRARSPLIGVLAGLLITALVQSSSITIGLAILLVQQGMLAAAGAIPIVIGCEISGRHYSFTHTHKRVDHFVRTLVRATLAGAK